MSRSKYIDGEQVLCYQGLLIYEAKIQGVRKESNVFEYDVHYKGWNKTWDEWVTDERLLKYNPENLKKQKQVEEEIQAKGKTCASKRGGGSSGGKKPYPSEGDNSQKGETSLDDRKKKEPTNGEKKKAETSLGEKRKLDTPAAETKRQKVSDPQFKSLELTGKGPRSRSNSDASVVSGKSVASSRVEETARPKRTATDTKTKQQTTASSSQVSAGQGKKKASEPAGSKKKTKKDQGSKSSPKAVQKTKPPERKVLFGEGVRIELPESLKSVLVDDFDYMIRQRKLTTLPSRYTVEDLINAYNQSKREEEGKGGRIVNVDELCRGLRDYFNATLGCQLLYKFERIQYADILKDNPGVEMCTLYGPVHLLRLITKLGPMLSAADVEKSSLEQLVENLADFILYISRHIETLFQIEDYGTASPEYHRRAL